MTNKNGFSDFTTESDYITEIINLKAILNLPKGTEHFVSDLHGEYDAFQHVLRNGSGTIRIKTETLFQEDLAEEDLEELIYLIYYPEQGLKKVNLLAPPQKEDWYSGKIQQLIELVHFVSTKYTRSKVRKALPKNFVYVIEELLYRPMNSTTKKDYYQQIISEIISFEQAPAMIAGLCYSIQRLSVDHLHVLGDIYDRGPAPDKIMDTLMEYHSLDIQWGNHDIIWIGAVAGSALCLINLIRISARYDNLAIIEESYGINLEPLAQFAKENYQVTETFQVQTKNSADSKRAALIQQATAIIQFKLEGQLIERRPEFKMDHRRLLPRINFEKSEIELKGQLYSLTNTCFTTIAPQNPEELTKEENEIVTFLLKEFQQSPKLKKHMDFLMTEGKMYLQYNDNLLFHGCLPLEADGEFQAFQIDNHFYQGRSLLDFYEKKLRKSYREPTIHDDFATDLIWYLWSGELSPLFGKKEMTTFERYFIADKKTHHEERNSYYALREEEKICQRILKEFDLDAKKGRIINGHTPVEEVKGENPIKANGRMLVIDGGYSRPYQKKTGIAGYTLIYNSFGMKLVAHETFASLETALAEKKDIVSTTRVVNRTVQRKTVRETTIGQKLQEEIQLLEEALSRF